MVQQFWYYLLRSYVWIGLRFYFKKIIIHGRENIPSGPIIFTANHQNAFMDALMIVCHNSRMTHFLARADIFRKPVIGWLLDTLNMVPIYRIRDGWQSLSENQKTFDRCDLIFCKNEAVVIFPEGNHGHERRLRPLSRGFVKVAFESLKKHADMKIHIVPVGLNYSDPSAFRGSVSLFFGKPVLANEYFKEPMQKESNRLRQEISHGLQQLITHIHPENYNTVFHKLEASHPDYLDPADTNSRIARIERNETITSSGIVNTPANRLFPFLYPFALLVNFIPLLVWHKIRKGIKDPVFITSMKFGTGIFLFPFFYLLMGMLLLIFSGPRIAGIWLVLAFLSPFFLRSR